MLPGLLQRALGRVLGAALYLLLPWRRKIVGINLRLCFPELSRRAREWLRFRVFLAYGIGLVESARAWWDRDARLRPLVAVEGLEPLRRTTASGRGVLLLGCHFTTLDLGGRFFALHHPMDVSYRLQNHPLLDELIRSGRSRHYAQVIERSRTRQLVKRLREGRVVWYAADQDFGPEHSVFAPFFAIPCATLAGVGRLARAGQAEIFMMSHQRLANGRYRLRIARVEGVPGESEVADATCLNAMVEAAVRHCPEQYLWFHRRFKTPPPGRLRPYPPRRRRRAGRGVRPGSGSAGSADAPVAPGSSR